MTVIQLNILLVSLLTTVDFLRYHFDGATTAPWCQLLLSLGLFFTSATSI